MTSPDARNQYNMEDPFSAIKEDKSSRSANPREVARFHDRDDTDSGPTSHHHTLGTKHTQSSFGDHTHNSKNSRPVGFQQGLTVTGSRGANAALASLIAELKKVIDITDNTTP